MIIDSKTTRVAWDKLHNDFEGSARVIAIKLLTLKKEFEILKMKDSDTARDYTTK